MSNIYADRIGALYLPDEAWLHILSYLNVSSLVNFERCSRGCRQLALDGSLWKRICLFKYWHPAAAIRQHQKFDWKNFYVQTREWFRGSMESRYALNSQLMWLVAAQSDRIFCARGGPDNRLQVCVLHDVREQTYTTAESVFRRDEILTLVDTHGDIGIIGSDIPIIRAVSHADGTVRHTFDIENSCPKFGTLDSVAVRDDLIVAGSGSGYIVAWSISTGEKLRTLFVRSETDFIRAGSSITCIRITRDCRNVVAGTRDGYVKFWRTTDWCISRQFRCFDKSSVHGMSVSDDDNIIAVIGYSRVKIYCNGQRAMVRRNDGGYSSIFTDGRVIVWYYKSDVLKVTEIATGRTLRNIACRDEALNFAVDVISRSITHWGLTLYMDHPSRSDNNYFQISVKSLVGTSTPDTVYPRRSHGDAATKRRKVTPNETDEFNDEDCDVDSCDSDLPYDDDDYYDELENSRNWYGDTDAPSLDGAISETDIDDIEDGYDIASGEYTIF